MNVRYPSLELAWLPLSDRKTLSTPRIVMLEEPDVGGYYSARGVRYIGGTYPTHGERDTIVVSTHWGDGRIASTLAHEYRHMQQWYVPSLPKIRPAPWPDWSDWERAIRRFYHGRPWELDALRYERRHAPDQDNEQAMQVVMR